MTVKLTPVSLKTAQLEQDDIHIDLNATVTL